MRKVLLIEAQIKQYRLPFYEQLYSMLGADHIELKVGYSERTVRTVSYDYPNGIDAKRSIGCHGGLHTQRAPLLIWSKTECPLSKSQ